MQRNESLDSTLALTDKSRVLIVVETLIFFVLDIAAFVGNLMICVAFYRDKRLLTATNVFVLSLSLTDLFQSLFVMPLSVGASISQEWIFGYFGCQFMEILGYIFAGVSIETLTIIAFNRYLCVVRPLRYRRIFTTKKATIVAIATWIATASYLGFGIPLSGIEFRPSPNKVVCAPFLDDEENISQLKLLVLLLYSLMFFIASIFIPTCYIQVFLALRRHRTRISSFLHETRSSKSCVANVNTNNNRLGNISINVNKDQQVNTKQKDSFGICKARRAVSEPSFYVNKDGISDIIAKENSVGVVSTKITMDQKDTVVSRNADVTFGKQTSVETASFTDVIAKKDSSNFNVTIDIDQESYDAGPDQEKFVTIGTDDVTDQTNDSVGVNVDEHRRGAVINVDANSNVEKCVFVNGSEKVNDIANSDNRLINAIVQTDSNDPHYESGVFIYNSGITTNSNNLVTKIDDARATNSYRTVVSVSKNSIDSVDSLDEFIDKIDSRPSCALDVHDLKNTAANTTDNFKNYVKESVTDTSRTTERPRSPSEGDSDRCVGQVNDTPNFNNLTVANDDKTNNSKHLVSYVSKTKKRTTIHSSWQSQRAVKEAKLTKLLAVTVAGFYVCWLPAFIYGVLYVSGVLEKDGKLSYLYSNFIYTFPVYMSSTINPLIYATMNKTFRGAFCKLFSCKCVFDS